MRIVTLLTDFGTRDYYVAAVKGTVLRLAPGCLPVDLSHEVAPGDVGEAAFLLAAALPTYPAGTVHLAVVDPGVGSRRRILAAEAAGSLVVAPDNGLLTPLLQGARVRSVERGDLYLEAPGATFHGRDRFAPVAAFLARGGEPGELGPVLEDPVRLHQPAPRRRGRRLEGRVVHIDRFGNLVTDIPTAWLGGGPLETPRGEAPMAEAPMAETQVAGHTVRHLATHYAQIPAGEAAVIPGSLGTLELSLDGADLARRWGVERGAAVEVLLPEG